MVPKGLLKLGGALITVIGLITLPDELNTLGNRFGDVAGAIKDNPVSGVAVLVGILLLAVGFSEQLKRAMFGGRRWNDNKYLGDTLHSWLRTAGFTLTEREQPGLVFVIDAVEPRTNRPISVYKLSTDPGVRLGSRVILMPNQVKFFQGLGPAKQRAILTDVAIELARLDIAFDGRDVVNTGFAVETGFIPSDTLTPSRFLERVSLVSRAILLMQFTLSRDLPEPEGTPATVHPLAPDMARGSAPAPRSFSASL